MKTRNIVETDYAKVTAVLNEWWGGRQMTHLLPRLFFEHFQQTSFVVEDYKGLAAFIIGFVSQTNPQEAYIHFVGVNPTYRKQGLAKELYGLFFDTVKQRGCHTVRCITTPINEGSIAFHQSMGFSVVLGKDYAGEGQDRILFSREI